MIAVWMLYCVGIGLAFVVVGYALEKGLHLAGVATRWAWLVALVGSGALPAAAWLRPDAFPTFASPIGVVTESPQNSSTVTSSTVLATSTERSFSLNDLDTPLRWAWGIASLVLLLTLAMAAARLSAWRRRWREAAVDGRRVLVSPNTGPAVVGLWSPRVVLPEWALALSIPDRELMLAHEEQHIRAADPALLAVGFGLVLLAPWNLALWWQWWRLRLAVEMDCDARVLAAGRSAVAYGELLVSVCQRRTRHLVGAAAFGEPMSFLASRVRRMLSQAPRWRWAGVVTASAVAVGAMIGACETPRPSGPSVLAAQSQTPALVQGDGVNSAQVLPLLTHYLGPNPRRLADSAMIAWFVVDQPGHVVGWGTAPQTQRDSLLFGTATAARVVPGYDTLKIEAVLVHVARELPPTIVVRLGDNGARPEAAINLPRLRTKLTDALENAQRHADFLRRLAREYEPAAFTHPRANTAIAMVVDSGYRVIAHTVGLREPTDNSCVDVLQRLLPNYRNVRFATAGCLDADEQRHIALYWGQIGNR